MGLGQTNLEEFSESPREHIPDAWARKGHCPVCNASKSLDINHLPEAPDQFVCKECGTAFEVQSTGSKIRVMLMPEVLKPAWMEIINRWMAPPDIQRLYKRYSSSRLQDLPDEEGVVPEPEMTNREVMSQAIELQRLGNSYEMIRALLLQVGATPRQADGAVGRLQRSAEKEKKKRSCFMWAMAAVAVLVLAVIGGVLWFTSRTPAPETLEDSDALFSQFDPAEVVTDLVGIPTPQVVYNSGPGDARCPASAAQAAELFGGQEDAWSKERGYDAWVLVNVGPPVTIRVPANMVAGYMKMDSMDMLSVQGPATLHNINFIVVSCE